MSGPLAGVRVVELASLGPGPFGAMMLADMGADVIRLERGGPAGLAQGSWNLMHRNRPSVAIDLKAPGASDLVLDLVTRADALIEGFRPGVVERLGLGPEEVMARNPRLVYARMTGYGQDGPMSQVPGHDINYLAIAGALGAMQRRGERPMFPLNLLGDFGGGGMLLAFGVVCGVLEARVSGRGQVVDVSMVDGVALLTAMIHALRSTGQWSDEPGTNLLDSGAHFYEVYETRDGRHVAVGALEAKFYDQLLDALGLPAHEMPQSDPASWPKLKQRMAEVFATRTRDEWAELLEPLEGCATAVYGLGDAPLHPHNAARQTFVSVAGTLQPAPAPRFSRTPGSVRTPPPEPGQNTDEALGAWGVDEATLAALRADGTIG